MNLAHRAMRWIVGGLATLITFYGFLLGFGAAQSSNAFWIAITFALAGWFPVVFVHELGHAVVAQLAGWRVWIFHVAPLALRTRPLALHFAGYMGGPDIAGFVLALPKDASADTWRRSAWVSAGGPIASWLFTALCFSIPWWPLLPNPYSPNDPRYYFIDNTWIAGLIVALGCYSLAAALLCSWPNKLPSGRSNDGQKILETLTEKSTFGLPRTAAQLARALWHYNVPVSAHEPWMIEALRQQRGLPSPGASAMLTSVLDALVRDDAAAAQSACDALSLEHPLSLEAGAAEAFAAVWFKGDVAKADAILPKLTFPSRDDCFRLRQLTLAAIHRREGEIEVAERVLEDLMSTSGGSYRFSSPAWETLVRQVMTRQV